MTPGPPTYSTSGAPEETAAVPGTIELPTRLDALSGWMGDCCSARGWHVVGRVARLLRASKQEENLVLINHLPVPSAVPHRHLRCCAAFPPSLSFKAKPSSVSFAHLRFVRVPFTRPPFAYSIPRALPTTAAKQSRVPTQPTLPIPSTGHLRTNRLRSSPHHSYRFIVPSASNEVSNKKREPAPALRHL